MFTSLKQRLLLGLYLFLILSIPIGAYLASQYQNIKSSAKESKTTKSLVNSTPKSATSSARKLLDTLDYSSNPLPPASSSPTIATSFGPTLSLSAVLEGRPAGNQAVKLFVGIAEGDLSANPRFLLNFTVDLPDSGQYSNLSLAGLTPGTKYTALLKGSAQIATSSAFIMSPTVTNLNGGQPLSMLTGDLNDDNVVNQSDFAIMQKAYGATSTLSNWNELADFNKDGIINIIDLAIINKNLNQIGASGAWTSPLPKTSTPSASLTQPIGGSSQGGYWMWIPGSAP